jgi:glycosyltransferase involved in cell wall biosynthesis
VRILIYTDAVYREHDGQVSGEIAFTLYAAALAGPQTEVTLVGRLDRESGPGPYPLPSEVRFHALPHYASLTEPVTVLRSLFASLRSFWRALDDADAAWLFGPYLHALLFALLALGRRRRVVLGVRQNFPAYVRSRRPGVRWMHLAADVLEAVWRALARFEPVVVVGPELAREYRHSPRLLNIAVSMIGAGDIALGREAAATRNYDGPLRLLSVGRIDQEKNPLLLADVLAGLRAEDPRWGLVICGDGALQGELEARLHELGVSEFAEFRGHVPLNRGLLEIYRTSHVFLHVSLTEGMPQVLGEAFASGTPSVATAVGGVAEAAGGAAVLIPPADAAAAVAAIRRLAADGALRDELTAEGFRRAEGQTREDELRRVLQCIEGD